MAETYHSDTVAIADDLKFQRRTWKVQRVGWAIMVLISVAALLGVFGKGPRSRTGTSATTPLSAPTTTGSSA